jgi:hypothetical protein
MPHRRWTDAGFQGPDPAKDFRGGGIYSLLNLLYMAEHYPQVFHQLMHKTEGVRADFEYPFSVAGDPSREFPENGSDLIEMFVCSS